MTPNLRQHLNRFVRVAIANSWSGGGHPEDVEHWNKKWLRTRINFHKRLSSLEQEISELRAYRDTHHDRFRLVLKRYYQRGQRIRELEKYLEELER